MKSVAQVSRIHGVMKVNREEMRKHDNLNSVAQVSRIHRVIQVNRVVM